MSEQDKAANRRENLKGKVKEAWGRVTGDPVVESEGKADQRKSDLKQAGEKVKDAVRPRDDRV